MVLTPGLWCRTTPEPLDAFYNEVQVTAENNPSPKNRLDDDDYPAYTMGRAAEMLGTTPAFLRAIGEARLITPLRSEGGHRRYSRYQLRIAARARELVDGGTPVDAACRIVILEDQLEEAKRINAELRRPATKPRPRTDA
ncbi:MAG: MerR family transcriptional regulator [Streptomyces oryziradicis]|nr:MerR family transcriptional regulator [Actinacidiphila oryziradicis]